MKIFEKKKLIGEADIVNARLPSYQETNSSLFRVTFKSNESNIGTFIYVKFGIFTFQQVKIFVGIFGSSVNNLITENTVIQVPLLGQSIKDLSLVVNKYPNVVFEPMQGNELVSTLSLADTNLLDGTNKWVYFESNESSKFDYNYFISDKIKFFKTSAEPLAAQLNNRQSLGGFVSLSEIDGSAFLSYPVSLYDTTLYINPDSFTQSYTINNMNKSKYLQINDEIVEVNRWDKFTVYLSRRNVFGTALRYHPAKSIVRAVFSNSFFDTSFSKDNKQYRCFAVKNIDSQESLKNVKVFFKNPSRNNLSGFKLAIETPTSDSFSSSVSSGGLSSFSCNELINKFPNNYFVGAPILFSSGLNQGQNRLIKSFISSTGTITIDQPLSNVIKSNDLFDIDTAPSQRVKSSFNKPIKNNFTSDFYNADSEDKAISININNRISQNDLNPGECIYIWIEREISELNSEFKNNTAILSLLYSKT